MRKQNQNNLSAMRTQYINLAYGQARVVANRNAVAAADQMEESPYYRVIMRRDLAWALAVGDDPAVALPVCAEYFSLLEQYPDALSDNHGSDIIGVAMVAFHTAFSLPQIPLAQCNALLGQFEAMVKRYGMGDQIFHLHLCNFYQKTGRMEEALTCYEKAQSLPRDGMSDCPTCDVCNRASFLVAFGRREEGEEMARPVLEGQMTCEQQPQEILSVLLKDDLKRGCWTEATLKAKRLYRIAHRNKNDLGFVGDVLRCWAFTDLDRAVTAMEKHLKWSIGMWEQTRPSSFFIGAWLTCAQAAKKREVLQLNLPSAFPLYQEDGTYPCQVLADWFYDKSAEIAAAFDGRNGTTDYADELNQLQGLLRKNEEGVSQ